MTLLALHLLLTGGWIIVTAGQDRHRRRLVLQGAKRDLRLHWLVIKRVELPLAIALMFTGSSLRHEGPVDPLLRVQLALAMTAVVAAFYRFWLVHLAQRMAAHHAWDLFAILDRRQALVGRLVQGALAAGLGAGFFRLF